MKIQNRKKGFNGVMIEAHDRLLLMLVSDQSNHKLDATVFR